MSGSPPRSTPVQTGPPASLTGIPIIDPGGTHWFREHGHRHSDPDHGCWYHAPLPAGAATGGRFDVPEPEGTCSFADGPLVAAMERVGRFTAQNRPVPADLVDGRVVTAVTVATLRGVAVDLLDPSAAAHFRVTGESFTTPEYSVPQEWARALCQHGYEALAHTPRSAPSGRALAAFGPHGSHPRSTAGTQLLVTVLHGAGIPIAATPPASATGRTPHTARSCCGPGHRHPRPTAHRRHS